MSTLSSAATWSIGLWRLASGRIRADWRFLVGVWLLLACATTLLASGILYGDAVALGSLRSAVRGVPAADQGVLVGSSLKPAQIAAVDVRVEAALRAVLGGPGGPIALQLRSTSLVPTGLAAGSASAHLTLLESIDGVADHAALVGGRWPVPGKTPVEASLSEAAAQALGLAVGATVKLADASAPNADPNQPLVTVTIVGIYRPAVGDATWGGDALDLNGTAPLNGATYQGPYLVDRADLLAVPFADVDARWRAVPDIDRLTADDIDPLRTRVAGLADHLEGLLPAGSVDAAHGIGTVLGTISHSLQVARGAVLVLTLQYAVVAAYAVLLVAGMLADRRRPEIGLLRSRGASTAHVVALAFGEALLLAIPAAAVAPFGGAVLVRLVGQVGPLAATGAVADVPASPAALLAVGLTALVETIVLTFPALGAGAEVAGIRALLGRPVARTLAQRLGIDVALVAVAAVAIWQLRNYGAPITHGATGALGLDPLLVAAPAFGLVAGGVLATRLVPRLGEVGERVLSRARGLLSPLAARQIARRPLRYTRAALLLMLSTALGTFGAVYATTWAGSHLDQASYEAGADVRVTATSSVALPEWALGPAYRAIPGVTHALAVGRGDLSVGQVVRTGVLLTPDTRSAPGVIALPPGPEAAALPAGINALAAARPEIDGLALPSGARRLRLDLDAALTEAGFDFGNGPIEIPADYRGITVAVVVRDADGGLEHFVGASTQDPGLFVGRGETLIVPLDGGDPGAGGTGSPVAARPAEPRTVIGIEISLANAFGFFANPITGTFELTGLDASASLDAADWAPMDLAGAATWRWKEADDKGTEATIATGTGAVTLNPTSDFASQGSVPLRLIPDAPADATIPAIAGDQLLALTGSAVGDTLESRSGGRTLNLRIVGRTAEFPTIDPATPFAVIDGPTLALQRYLSDGALPSGSEWWLSTSAGASGRVAAALTLAPFRSRAIVERDGVLAALENDPVGLGTLGALLLGSLAAAAFAVVGFLVGASVSVRERLSEFALLRALGLSSGQLSRWMVAEQAFLLGVGVLAGTGVGLILAALIVPATLLSSSGAPIVPVPTLVIPWAVLGLLYLGAVALLAVTAFVVGRPLPGRSVASALRTAEE